MVVVLYLWELALIPIYFIALIWGNGDAEERKSSN
jgi:NADH-quinone oxidoreductase subunit M